MELDDLKNAWAQYDKKLKANLKVNEALLRKINLNNSKREMNAPLIYEIISVIGSGLMLMFIISFTFQFATDIRFLITGTISIVIGLIGLVFSIQKLKLLARIDYYNMSVVELQKALAAFKLKYLQYKKGEIFVMPIFVIALMPIYAKGMHDFDILLHPERFIIGIIIASGVAIPTTLWIYKNWYDKKLKNTNNFLVELNKFEKEE